MSKIENPVSFGQVSLVRWMPFLPVFSANLACDVFSWRYQRWFSSMVMERLWQLLRNVPVNKNESIITQLPEQLVMLVVLTKRQITKIWRALSTNQMSCQQIRKINTTRVEIIMLRFVLKSIGDGIEILYSW